MNLKQANVGGRFQPIPGTALRLAKDGSPLLIEREQGKAWSLRIAPRQSGVIFWELVPPTLVPFWKKLFLALLDSGEDLGFLRKAFTGLSNLHKWLEETSFQFDPDLGYDQITSTAFGRLVKGEGEKFKNWKRLFRLAIDHGMPGCSDAVIGAIDGRHGNGRTATESLIPVGIPYQNAKGAMITVGAGGGWRLDPPQHVKISRKYLYWDRIPPEHRLNCQFIVKTMFDQGAGLGTLSSVVQAFSKLHQWLKASGTDIETYDQLKAMDFGRFDEWVKEQPKVSGKHGKPLKTGDKPSIGFRKGLFASLSAAFREAATLGIEGCSDDGVLNALLSAGRNRHRHVNLKREQRRANRVLTVAESDSLYAAIGIEFRRGIDHLTADEGERLGLVPRDKALGFRNRRSVGGFPWVRVIDMHIATAAWLALAYGVRTEELPHIKLADLYLHGDAPYLRLVAPNKDESRLELDEEGVTILSALVAWTQRFRHLAPLTQRDYLFLDWKWDKESDSEDLQLQVTTSANLALRFRPFVVRYDIREDATDGKPRRLIPTSLRNLRSTFGDRIADQTSDEQLVQHVMRHEHITTALVHYRTKNRVQHARIVTRALGHEAMRYALLIGLPVLDLEKERPDAVQMLATNPDRDIDFGICVEDETIGCDRANHCFTCPQLIVLTSRRDWYVREKDRQLLMATTWEEREGPKSRKAEQHRTIARRAEAIIRLVDRRLEDATSKEEAFSTASVRRKKMVHAPVDF